MQIKRFDFRALMKTECHLGAMSAFTLAMKLAPKMPELYVERAAAQLALRNFIKTVEDASQVYYTKIISHPCRIGCEFWEIIEI